MHEGADPKEHRRGWRELLQAHFPRRVDRPLIIVWRMRGMPLQQLRTIFFGRYEGNRRESRNVQCMRQLEQRQEPGIQVLGKSTRPVRGLQVNAAPRSFSVKVRWHPRHSCPTR